MLSTLHQFLNLKKDSDLPDYSRESRRSEIVARLYYLLNKLTEAQKLTLLKQLLQNKTVDYLFKLIIDLSDNQRVVLMKQLEEITVKPSRYDRREYPRKDCLINSRISVNGRIFSCFILDISPYGAFIDTDEGILEGQSAKLMFSSPHNRAQLILSGEVVWIGSQGSGIKFNQLTPKQLNIIRSFTDNKQTVYEITS